MTKRIFRFGLSGGDAVWNAKNPKQRPSPPPAAQFFTSTGIKVGPVGTALLRNFPAYKTIIADIFGAQRNRPW